MPIDPFTLASLGIGTVGSLVGGIQQAFEAPRKKREFLEDERKKAQITALRHGRWTRQNTMPAWDEWFPGYAVDAKMKQDATQKYADENFDWNPMSLLPFVQSGTKLAGGIYDYANQPAADATPTKHAKPGDTLDVASLPESLRPYDASAHMSVEPEYVPPWTQQGYKPPAWLQRQRMSMAR